MEFSIIESTGVMFGIAGVWLTVRRHIACWPTGLISVAIFAVVFFRSRLYGAALLQLVYVVLLAYGWYRWLHPGAGRQELPVTRTPRGWWIGLGAAGIVFAAGLGLFLKYRTDAALPFLDAATTAFSLVAQWQTARKWIENWLVWLAVDLVLVGMYLSQGLYQTAALYAVFLVLAGIGFLEWNRALEPAEEPAP